MLIKIKLFWRIWPTLTRVSTPSLVYFRDFLTLQDPKAKPITTMAGILRDGILMDNYNL